MVCPRFGPAVALSVRQQRTDHAERRFSEQQIIAVLREQEAGATTADVCRRHGVSEPDVLPVEGEVWRHGCL